MKWTRNHTKAATGIITAIAAAATLLLHECDQGSILHNCGPGIHTGPAEYAHEVAHAVATLWIGSATKTSAVFRRMLTMSRRSQPDSESKRSQLSRST